MLQKSLQFMDQEGDCFKVEICQLGKLLACGQLYVMSVINTFQASDGLE
jgi:hypothetical protein